MTETAVAGEVVLEAKELSAGYGSMAVVRGLDLQVRAGQVVTLLGPNGAGKTTTLLTLAGVLGPLAGQVLVDGQATKAPLHVRARSGLAFVPEERSVIGPLTAADNLRLARVSERDAIELFPELEPLMRRPAGVLSGGEQQMLTLARVLGRHPRVMIVDELSLGLAPLIVERLLEVVRRAATDLGVGVLLVEQHVQRALRISDQVYVMRRGRMILEGSPATVRDELAAVEAAYLAGDGAGPADPADPT